MAEPTRLRARPKATQHRQPGDVVRFEIDGAIHFGRIATRRDGPRKTRPPRDDANQYLVKCSTWAPADPRWERPEYFFVREKEMV